MRADRLLRLAEFLEALPPEAFDYSDVFASDDWGVRKCGTTACAMGWATTIPEFKKAGLKRRPCGSSKVCMVKFGDRFGSFEACASFFEISEDDSYYLFDPGDSKLGDKATATQVAAHIREYVREAGR